MHDGRAPEGVMYSGVQVDTSFKFINHIISISKTINRIKLGFHTLLKLIFGCVVVVVTLFLWAFPFGQLLLIVFVCVAIGAYALHKTKFGGATTKGIQDVSYVSHAVPPPPSDTCPTCHHVLTFIEQYKAWYCFNCKQYK